MSEDDISDKIDYVMAKKLGAYSKMTGELEVLGQLSGFTSGPEMDFYTAQRMKKMSYKMMTPINIFLDSVIKRDKLKYSITDNEFGFLTNAANKLPYIQYKNPGGILYAYRYYILVSGFQASGQMKENTGTISRLKTLKSFFDEAAELNVPAFDIFRYYRLLVEYELLPSLQKIIPIEIDFKNKEDGSY